MEMTNTRRWLITATIMLVAVIELLDMTIVSVALNNMMGALSANRDQITWVMTAYIVAAAIVILLTGFLTSRFGRRRVLLIAVIGFLISSALCGAAPNLTMMVIFRIFQGICGAVFIPTSQAILKSIFPEKDQGLAMAIWAIGLMTAPVLGPTVGGYIIDHWNWRWCFYINVPICIISFFMVMHFIEETPKIKCSIDWWGILLIILGVGCLQIFLDQGNTSGWLQSHTMVVLLAVAIFCLSFLIYRCFTVQNPILNLRLFRHYNFTICTFMIGCYAASMLGSMSLQPLFLQQLLNYPAGTAGIVLAPRGLSSACAMLLVGRYIKKVDSRWFIAAGIVVTAFGTYMMTNYNLQMDPYYVILSSLIQGIGMGLSIVPLATLCTYGFDKKDLPQGTSLFSFSRSLGNAIGVSMLITIITRQTQVAWNQLGSHLIASNTNLVQWFHTQHQTIHNPQALAHLSEILYTQASNIAFIDMFWTASIVLIILLPFVYFLKIH